jgi:transcriptional antiterminator RfaH
MNHESANPPAWFCVRAKIKQERIAAAHLRRLAEVEVFLPRIRFQRSTPKGPVWTTEAMFPNYLFVRLAAPQSLRMVHYCTGVNSIVHFGNQWPTIPDAIIEELRRDIGPQAILVVSPRLKVGDPVAVAGGILHGLEAVVSAILPGRERVRVLMEFLGRQTAVEIPVNSVVRREE